MPAVKKLTKCGNSQAVVLDRSMLNLVGISPDSWVSITTDGNRLILEPAKEEDVVKKEEAHKARLRAAIDKTHQRFDGVLKRLAE